MVIFLFFFSLYFVLAKFTLVMDVVVRTFVFLSYLFTGDVRENSRLRQPNRVVQCSKPVRFECSSCFSKVSRHLLSDAATVFLAGCGAFSVILSSPVVSWQMFSRHSTMTLKIEKSKLIQVSIFSWSACT